MRHGDHARTANNAASALKILSRKEIHPTSARLDAAQARWLRGVAPNSQNQRDRFAYIIVASAAASATNRQKVLDLGANEYMPKPFHLNRLLERVQAVEKFLY